VSAARSVTKRDLEVLSDLVFDSYVTIESEVLGHEFVFRSLKTSEREEISRKYKRLSNKYNIKLVLDILSISLLYVDGFEISREQSEFLLSRLSSRLVLIFYREYQKLDSSIFESSKFIDYYVETRDSRNMWIVFKTCSRVVDPFSIRKLNQYQFYWVVMNSHKDLFEEEKRLWAKTEYMTNSICAFVNPKAFRKSKGQMGIVEQLEEQEDKSKQKIVEELEKGEEIKEVESNDVFSSMNRLEGESEEQHETRVNVLMEKTLNGELVDEHDRIVRNSEIDSFKKLLREKRVQVLVEREVFRRQGIRFEDSASVLENEAMAIELEENKKKGFFHEDFSYLEIVRMKDFAAVSKSEKEKAFDEVMSEDVDVNVEADRFLKSLSGTNNSTSDVENNIENNEFVTKQERFVDDSEVLADSNVEVEPKQEIVRTAAERAASMSVDVQGVDLMKQRQEKIKRVSRALGSRNKAIEKQEDENLDVMKFD
jgi:hypothetical protein